MAAHLRIGSVINYGSTYVNATVTNITGAYIEIEYLTPGGVTEVRVISWSVASANIVVVTD